MKNGVRPCFASLLLRAVIAGAFAISIIASGGISGAVDAAESIKIGGTGTALAVMRLLGEQFRKKHPEIAITVFPSLGSTGGVKALLGGDIDIAVSSNKPTDAEEGQGLVAVEYGKTPFVFVTHKTNKISNLTLKDVVAIYDGRMMAWPDGGPIRLILRPAVEASTKLLQGMSGDMDRAVRDSFTRSGLIVAITERENADLIERLPGAFGAASLCQLISEKRTLKVLSLNGIMPGVKTLADGGYPYFKDLYIITGPKSTPVVKKFIEYVLSPPGQSLLTRTGHLVSRQKK
jgi:phosphate transport system substrate-binding protein